MHKGKTVKTVEVDGIMGESSEEIMATALAFAGEDAESAWGGSVSREFQGDYGRALVTIHTD